MTERDLNRIAARAAPPSKLSHVVLRVTDLPRARGFYVNLLSARPVYENGDVCFMTYDDEHHRLGLLTRPGLRADDGNGAGLEHLAFTFDTLGELLAHYLRMKPHAVAPFWTINHGPTISFYYKDPDGNRIEFQYDVFRTPEAVESYFASGAHERNFMGVIVDPEDLIARFEAGDAIETITVRPELPAGVSPWDMHRA